MEPPLPPPKQSPPRYTPPVRSRAASRASQARLHHPETIPPQPQPSTTVVAMPEATAAGMGPGEETGLKVSGVHFGGLEATEVPCGCLLLT